MKKTLVCLLLATIGAVQSFAYESNTMMYTAIPSDLTLKQFEFNVSHKFQGKIKEDPFDNAFGMHGGASVAIGLRAGLVKGFEIGWQYLFYNREVVYGLMKNWAVSPILSSRIEISSHRYRPIFYLEDKESTIGGLLAIQVALLKQKLHGVVNLHYDGDYEKLGLGLGASYQLTKKIGLMAEFFPRRDKDVERFDSMVFGLRWNTYGHRFLFTFGNSRENSLRHVLRGSDTRDFYFGFGLSRLLEID